MTRTNPFMPPIMRCRAAVAIAAICLAGCSGGPATAQELIIGQERMAPGIRIVFEGAIKDKITPPDLHLAEAQTDVHLEALVNWDGRDAPQGAAPGGFVPYMDIVAQVRNERTGALAFVDLLPHINLVDGFHYARNVALPGARDDSYSVRFTIIPPQGRALGLHRDWVAAHGDALASGQSFTYTNIDFAAIAAASR